LYFIVFFSAIVNVYILGTEWPTRVRYLGRGWHFSSSKSWCPENKCRHPPPGHGRYLRVPKLKILPKQTHTCKQIYIVPSPTVPQAWSLNSNNKERKKTNVVPPLLLQTKHFYRIADKRHQKYDFTFFRRLSSLKPRKQKKLIRICKFTKKQNIH